MYHLTDDVFQAYQAVALWSSSNDEGTNFDSIEGLALHPKTIELLKEDLQKFFVLLESIAFKGHSLLECAREYGDDTDIAHNFWLTRNNHGSGFWAGSYGEIGDSLTALAKAFPEVTLLIGDNGLIYQY